MELVKLEKTLSFVTWTDLASSPNLPPQSYVFREIEKVFYASSERQEFSSLEEKKKFFWRWTDYAFNLFPSEILVALSSEKVLGYLMGIPDSLACIPYFQNNLPSQLAFSHRFDAFPSHLHMNIRPDARGVGLGTRLIRLFESRLQILGKKGLHVITSPGSRNVDFYRRNGFTFEETRMWNNFPLLFLGKTLRH